MDGKWSGISLALVAAAAIAYGVTIRSWWKYDLPEARGHATVGLREVELCESDPGGTTVCKTASHDELVPASSTRGPWMTLGAALYPAGMAAAGLLALAAFLAMFDVALAGALNPGRIAALACGAVAVAAAVFVFLPPGRGVAGLHRGGPVTVAGALLGATAAIRLFQWSREHLMRGIRSPVPVPLTDEQDPASRVRARQKKQSFEAISLRPGEVATPVHQRKCPTCGQPAEVAVSGWYCRRCQQTVE